MAFPNSKNLKLTLLLLTVSIFLPEHSSAFSNTEVVEILESNNSRIVFELKPYKIYFDEIFVNNKRYEIPQIEGCKWSIEPGKPRLPVKGILLAIPQDVTPRIQILESHSTPVGQKNLYPSPKLIPTEDGDGQYLIEQFWLDSRCYSQNSFYPGSLIEITSVGRLRNQRVARLEFHPVQYNPFTKELRKVDHLKVALVFDRSQQLKKQSFKPFQLEESSPFEAIYRNLLRNYQTARRWRGSGVNRFNTIKQVTDWYNPNNIYYKLFIEKEGIYRLDFAYLDSIGIDVGSVDPRTFKVYNKGKELPLYVRGQKDGRFDQDDYLEFYGQGNLGDSTYFDPYTDTNIYWLTWGGEQGLRIKTRSSLRDVTTKVNKYLERIHLEQDNFYYHGDSSLDIINTEQVSGEGWVWRFFYPGESGTFKILITHISDSDRPCRLKIKLRGTTFDPINPDHHVKVFLNDNFLGEIYFNDTEESLFETSFSATSLREGENRLVVTSIGDTGAGRDLFYLDWIELEYPRQLVAQDGFIKFTTEDGDNETAEFSLWDFNDYNIQLFDLTTNSIIESTAVNPGQRFIFKVISAGYHDGDFAQIYINSQVIVPSGHRGHNLAVVDEITGQLIETRHFDTYLSTAEADRMAEYIQNLPQGRIVLVAIRDEGSVSMTEAAYKALESLGSQLTRSVGYRDSWAMIGRKGAPIGSVPEKLTTTGNGVATVRDTLILAGTGQNYYLIFGDTLKQTKTYLAVGKSALKYPIAAKLDTTANLTSPENGADLIIITHKKFLSSAQRLAQYRASHNGLRVQMVDVEDIYDEFNFGLLNPQAIKDFLKYAFSHWQSPAPSYLLLFGDASWDFKKNMTSSIKENFVPSYGNPVSDNWFVCFDGPEDFLPEMFVGRIPVETEEEAEIVVDKIIAYENTPSDAWKKNILFITGGFNKAEQTTFINQSNFLIDHFVTPPPASCKALKIHKTTEGYIEGEKKNDILKAIDNGTLWVNFVGHAGSRTWDLMFNHPDIEELTNQNKYPFVTSMTCHTARFANPEITSFGEHFLTAENKGAIAFWGTSGWGYVFQDDVLLRNLFPSVLVDTVQILSEATTLAKIKLWEDWGSHIINVSTIQQYILLGDPITDIALPDKPDLALGPQDATFTPIAPAEADSSVTIKIKVHNWGLATTDSIRIDVFDQKDNQQMVPISNTLVLPPLGLVDSLSINWRIANQAGQHTIRVLLDPNNEIEEADESNNSQDFPAYVYSSRITVSRPFEFQLVPPHDLNLQVNNPTVISKDVPPALFQFEIDTTDAFNSPLFLSSPSIPEGKIVTRWKVPDLLDTTTYFWRCRTIEGSDFGKWVTSSFTTQSDGSEIIWTQKHPKQFVHNNFDRAQFSSHGGQIQARHFILQVESAGYNDGNFARILVNSQPVLEQHRGHNLVVIDPHTGQILATRTFDTYRSPDEANAMADFINGFDDGTYVLIGIKDEGSRNMTEAAYQALESIGSKLCRQVGFRDSWAIIGIKGAPLGSVKEQLTPSNQGAAVVQDTLINYPQHGSITSCSIGPANAWSFVTWSEDLSAPGTNITLDVLGFNKSSAQWDTLLRNLTNSINENLSSVSAQIYPLIKLRANLTDDDGLHTPILRNWAVSYEPVADLAISPKVVTLSADTVMEGGEIQVTAQVYNVGMATADSVWVRFLYDHPDSGKIAFAPDQLLLQVEVDSFKTVTRVWDSMGRKGTRQLFVELDPDNKINELNENNNSVSKIVFVCADTAQPQIAVTYDGKTIIDGDLVSCHPLIVATIRDNNPSPIADTSKVYLALDGERINYSGNEEVLHLIPVSKPDEPTLKARLVYRPELSDGSHVLEIIVWDAIGNSIYHRDQFQVISKFKLLNVMNYPNPFTQETDFTYVLTQPATEVSLSIFTVAGRLIQKFNYLPGNSGFNCFHWDGRDADGDSIANGVYLYRIVARQGQKKAAKISKFIIMR